MRLLITGAGGLLGSEVMKRAGPKAWGAGRAELDILDGDSVDRLLREHRPEWVINCAAFTHVDDCEGNEEAYRVNALGPEVVATACNKAGVRMLHLSTDYVFDGAKSVPYTEDDAPNPINEYGRAKLEGERRAATAHPEGVLIVRTAWLFGVHKHCFPSKILEAARQGKALRVVSDQIGSPTSAADLASALLSWLRSSPEPGVYHVVNSGEASRHQLAVATLQEAGIAVEVEAVRSDQMTMLAPRPRFSVLATRRPGTPPLRPWREALADFVRQLKT